MEDAHRGKLLVVATPIGNLADVSERMRIAFRDADVVCAEDTRVTGKLLTALGITAKLERLDENVLAERADGLIARIEAGETVAYATDAGMPGVSDPGLRLVAAARKAGVPVEVVPGPSAAVCAYVASGTEFNQYFFGGFLPRKSGELHAYLQSLRQVPGALVFYESPNRIIESLRVVAEVFPYRMVAVCRELTKLHEEVLRDSADRLAYALAERPGGVKGEIALVIDGPAPEERDSDRKDALDAARMRAIELLGEGKRVRVVAKDLAEEFSIPRNAAYDIALAAVKDMPQAGGLPDGSA